MAGTACARQVCVVYWVVAGWVSVCLVRRILMVAFRLHCIHVIWVPQCVFTN